MIMEAFGLDTELYQIQKTSNLSVNKFYKTSQILKIKDAPSMESLITDIFINENYFLISKIRCKKVRFIILLTI